MINIISKIVLLEMNKIEKLIGHLITTINIKVQLFITLCAKCLYFVY